MEECVLTLFMRRTAIPISMTIRCAEFAASVDRGSAAREAFYLQFGRPMRRRRFLNRGSSDVR